MSKNFHGCLLRRIRQEAGHSGVVIEIRRRLLDCQWSGKNVLFQLIMKLNMGL